MKDYEDLFNYEKIFKNQKYIIHAKPVQTDAFAEEVDLAQEIDQVGMSVTKSFNKKLDEVERQNVSLLR